MTGSPPELRSFLEAEMFFGVKKRERIAYAVAGGGLAIGLMGMIAVVTILPLKQTEAFLAIVDKDTGVAERVVAVEKAGMEQAEAIRQSLLFAYVTDRETYDQHDNEERILRAYTCPRPMRSRRSWRSGPKAIRTTRRNFTARAPRSGSTFSRSRR